MPEILLGISLMVALITCVTLYGQRENLARENSEQLLRIVILEDANQKLYSQLRAARKAAAWDGERTGDVDLDRLVGDRSSDSSEEK